ncbi:1417_t:CDS:1, partial [Gigaspora rosea]
SRRFKDMNYPDKIEDEGGAEVREPRITNNWTTERHINDDNKIMIFYPSGASDKKGECHILV